MKLPLKCICELKNVRRDGTSIIYIQFCYTAKNRTVLNTGLEIPPNFWLDDDQEISSELPESLGDVDQLNDELRRMFRVAEDLVRMAIKRKIADPVEFLKINFKKDLEVTDVKNTEVMLDKADVKINKEIFFQIDNYIESKKRKVAASTPTTYKSMRYRLKEFARFRNKEIRFEEMDYAFYEELVDFLTYDYVHRRIERNYTGLRINTVGTTVKQLRIFLNDRIKKKIIPAIDMSGWKVLEEDADTVFCTWEEIFKISNVDLSSLPYLESYRDDFVLGCFIGMRFSDFSVLEASDLRNDFLHKKQQKSDHTVIIPLRDQAKTILERRFSRSIPTHSNPEFNQHIKTIAKMAGLTQMVKHSYKRGNKKIEEMKPKYAWITSHTCRRSFCTNEFLAGTPVELIMKISGHKNVKDFYKYIRISNEQAAEKIKMLWIERGEIMEFQNQMVA